MRRRKRNNNLSILIRRRRRLAAGGWITLLLLLALAAADHYGLLRPSGNDWETFDRKSFLVIRVADGDTITVRTLGGDTPVRFIGVDAPELNRSDPRTPPDHWAERATQYTHARSEGKFVTLKLDSTQTRDKYDRLLAYVYLSDADCLNLDLIRDGQGYADRRFKHTLRPQFELAENEARRKGRGLWKDVKVEQMPKWRQEWLRRFQQGLGTERGR